MRFRREMRSLRMWRVRSPSESVVSWLVSRAVPLETRQAGIAEATGYDVQPPSLVRKGAEVFCVRHRVSHVSVGGSGRRRLPDPIPRSPPTAYCLPPTALLPQRRRRATARRSAGDDLHRQRDHRADVGDVRRQDERVALLARARRTARCTARRRGAARPRSRPAA